MQTYALPSDEEMVIRLEFVLEFIENNLENFPQYQPYWKKADADAGNAGFIAQKILSEIAWLLLVCERAPDLPASTRTTVDRIGGTLNRLLRDDANLTLAMKNSQHAASFAIAHFALTQLGYTDDLWDRLIRRTLSGADSKERYPYRILERLWVMSLYGIPTDLSQETVTQLSILSNDAHPLTMTDSDAYAYTHAPMYLTDFGRQPLPQGIDVAHIRATLNSAIAWQLIQRNYDLLGEFVLVSLLVSHEVSDEAAYGISTFFSVWDELGFLPSPSFDEGTFSRLPVAERPAYAFSELYHTNLVAGLLCASWISQPPTRTPNTPTRSTRHDAEWYQQLDNMRTRAEAYCGTLEAIPALDDTVNIAEAVETVFTWIDQLKDGNYTLAPGWEAGLRRVSQQADETQLRILLEGTLITAVRAYNLPLLANCLLLWAQARLPINTTLMQTLQFLQAQQLPSGAIGAPFLNADMRQNEQAITLARSWVTCLQALQTYVVEAVV